MLLAESKTLVKWPTNFLFASALSLLFAVILDQIGSIDPWSHSALTIQVLSQSF